jgi:hypothetical protein
MPGMTELAQGIADAQRGTMPGFRPLSVSGSSTRSCRSPVSHPRRRCASSPPRSGCRRYSATHSRIQTARHDAIASRRAARRQRQGPKAARLPRSSAVIETSGRCRTETVPPRCRRMSLEVGGAPASQLPFARPFMHGILSKMNRAEVGPEPAQKDRVGGTRT